MESRERSWLSTNSNASYCPNFKHCSCALLEDSVMPVPRQGEN